ncbi:hypothetical protein [Candidatus Bathycorpusculum sp.]|uniref:hypothetical protein n=1 Tax=Candidatus Bathycorpusculum sp. TaxID=2994959 RepID=UPI00282B57AE|nr:DUF2225 domain-containing protein [Candidatus Termitimicrobium sp.]MCL2685933.1 DUF2225 domain-containing protein [Candidatus Termitimicrobium sp.]
MTDSFEYTCRECEHVFKVKEAYLSIVSLYDSDGQKIGEKFPVTVCPKCHVPYLDFNIVKSEGAPHNA